MRKLASIALLLAAASLSAQGLKAFLPAASATKAASYLAAIDAADSAIRSRRAAARAEELEAEAAALGAFALLAAAEGGEAWADPEGSLSSAGAAAAFVEARAKALGAAIALSSGSSSAKSPGTAELEKKHAEAVERLRSLLAGLALGAKSAAGVEKILSNRVKISARIFPEIGLVQSFLRKAGTAGSRLSASAMAEGREELVAAALVARADAVLASAPAAAAAMADLAEAYGAYSAWISGFPLASCPGELGTSDENGPSSLSRGIAALAGLGPSRAASLVSAMEAGDGRDSAAAAAARRLAATWESLGGAGRRELAGRCAVSAATLAAFASALSPKIRGAAEATQPDLRGAMMSLNALAVELADSAEGGMRTGPEPALLLLRRPELAAIARSEPRYARLFDECSRRIDSAYRRAAGEAATALESSAQVKKAAAAALGSAPAALSVEAVDIGPADAPGRRLAFVAAARGQDGKTLRLPVRAELAAEAYARSFAKAFGSGAPAGAAGAQKALEEFGQRVSTAYDPSGAADRLSISEYPKARDSRLLSAIDIEREMIEGWRP